jgi:radical SAM superfamily enzyme YgiQ (UPF0313 family)
MKIIMLNPPFIPNYSRQSRSPARAKGGTFYYPYYLAYATGTLEKFGNHKIKLIDAVANSWSDLDTVKFIKKTKPDLVVIDTSTPSIYNDIKISEMIKKSLESVHINIVGTHPSSLTNETFELSDSIDSISRGEYDMTLVELANSLENHKTLKGVKGLSFRNDGKIIHNKPREFLTSKQLDELPFVSKIYMKHFGKKGIKKYFYASLLHPQVTILTARGCPFNCSFCNIPFKSSYRIRSIDNVLEEFEYIQNELPFVKEVMIEDDTFPVSKKRTIKLCKKIQERKINLTWSCNARVDMDYETLRNMKNAGCRLMCVGFENPVQNILDKINKKTTKNLQIKFMENSNKLGLLVNGCFILGLPGDTKETIRKTIEFAKELNPDTAQFYPIMVYPGTEAYEWAKKNKFLLTENFSKWLTKEGWHNTIVSRPGLSNNELVQLCDKARLEFYLRLDYLLKKFRLLMWDWEETKRTFKSGRTFFKYVIKILTGTYASKNFSDNTGL